MALLWILVGVITCTRAPSPPAGGYEEWLGVYLAGSKVGYSLTILEPTPAGYRFENRMGLRLAAAGQVENLSSCLTASLNPDLSLKEFDYELVSDGYENRVEGRVFGSRLNLVLISGGEERREERNWESPVYLAGVIGRLVAQDGFVVGKEYNIRIFDPTLLAVAQARVKVVGEERLELGDSVYQAYRVSSSLFNLSSTTWLDPTGRTLKEESPPEIEMIREPPEKALALEAAPVVVDIISLFAVRPDTTVSNPRERRYLKVELSGADLYGLDLADETQRISSYQPLRVEVAPPHPPQSYPLPIPEPREFLRPSLYIQSDDPGIVRLARKIIEGTQDAVVATQRLLRWVYENIEKHPTASAPSAVEVLRHRRGDCNEHAILYTALCRAVGIPCRIAVGLVYLEKAFYYHAWNEVYLGRWIPVDPTFGQFPADATHLKLKEGELEEQAEVLKVVGNLQIKVLEYR